MTYATNITPFQAQAVEHRFYNGHAYDCLFVKGTFRLTRDGRLLPLLEQPAFVINDIHEGGNDGGALAWPSDLAPFKPGSDVLFVGSARPAGGVPALRWSAGFTVCRQGVDQPLLKKAVQLTGPRSWHCGLLAGWRLSDIEPTSAVKLSYALAWGGASAERCEKPRDIHWPNPYGRGYFGRDRQDESIAYPAPQILDLGVDKLRWREPAASVGLSPVAGLQQERLQFAGTYDKRWEQEVKPNIPLDMQLDFWNAAPQDQVAKPYLEGGDEVRTVGLFPTSNGELAFHLPRYQVFAVPVRNDNKLDSLPLFIDTVLVDLDQRHVVLRWATLVDRDEGYDSYQLVAFDHNDRATPARKPAGARA